MDNCGDRFQRLTAYSRDQMPRGGLDWENQPEWIKRYPDAPQVALPSPRTKGGASLWETIKARASVRRYRGGALSVMELSRMLWAGQGITHRTGDMALRAAPSAGALYPLETYLVARAVDGVEPGLYHYAVGDHYLEQLARGDYGRQIATAAFYQRFVGEAPLTFVWSAVLERSRWKYRQRAYRYIYLDAGHLAQNVALAATGLGLGSCQIAAFFDGDVNALFSLDAEQETALYITAVGRP